MPARHGGPGVRRLDQVWVQGVAALSLRCPYCRNELGLSLLGLGLGADDEAYQGGDEAQLTVGKAHQPAFEQSKSLELIKAKRRKNRYEDSRFEEFFWDYYPNRVGKEKAYRRWREAMEAGVQPHTILAAVLRFVAYCDLNPWYHPKYPEGWLNDGRWADEIKLPAAVGATDPAYIVGTAEYAARVQAEEDRAIAEAL